MTASGAGVNLKLMPDESGNPVVPMRESFAFDPIYAQCIVEDNAERFAMDTFEMGRVVIEPHQFFMAMYADTVGLDEIRQNAERIAARPSCSARSSVRPSPAPPVSRSARGRRRSTPLFRIEATDGGPVARAPPDSFAFTVYFDSDEAPVNHGIFGPEFTFTGEMIAGKITVGKPIGLTVADDGAMNADGHDAGGPTDASHDASRRSRSLAVGHATSPARFGACRERVYWRSQPGHARGSVAVRGDAWALAHLAADHRRRAATAETGATNPGRADRAGRAARATHRRDAGDHRAAGTIRRSSCPGRTSPSTSSGSTRQIRSAPRGRWPCCMSRSSTRSWRPGMPARPTRDRVQRRTRRSSPWGVAGPEASSFPSDQAAVAAAASTVLAYLFPKESAEAFAALAEEAATSQLLAARAFRSDVEAGQAIGRAVGERAVARGKADGSDASWDGSGRLTGPGSWQPTPPGYFQQPAEPLAGTWRTWILASGDQYRPAPPPPYQSPAWQAELVGVQEAVARRTPEQEAAVRFWAGAPGR